jgi:hypothetical protein
METEDVPTVTFTGQNLAEVQAWLRERDADVTTEFDSRTGLTCTVRAYDGDYPLVPGGVIIQDTAGSVMVMPEKSASAPVK